MDDHSKLESLQNFLTELEVPITNALKAISFPIRFRILTLLLPKDQTFSYFIEKTALKKSALAKHLNVLLENSLIEKKHHGHYKITQKGIYYLIALKEANEKINNDENKKLQFTSSKAFLDFHERSSP